MARVSVVMGSKTDQPLMEPALEVLRELGIEHEVSILSAHRTPERVREHGQGAQGRGIEVIIAGAGGAPHLAGALAGWTTVPVIGVPLATSELKGFDALYSTVQMPTGVPVACVAVNGARNAALLAAAILGLKDEAIAEAYRRYRRDLAGG